VNFTVDTGFANPAGNELSVLGTEIQDQDPMVMNILRHTVFRPLDEYNSLPGDRPTAASLIMVRYRR